MLFFLGMRAGTEGARKRMPVTCASVAQMPRVAKGVRTHAWNDSKVRDPSGPGVLAREVAELAQQIRREGDARSARAGTALPALRPRKPHPFILDHRGDQRLDALEEDLVARERRGVHDEEGLPDPRGAPF